MFRWFRSVRWLRSCLLLFRSRRSRRLLQYENLCLRNQLDAQLACFNQVARRMTALHEQNECLKASLGVVADARKLDRMKFATHLLQEVPTCA